MSRISPMTDEEFADFIETNVPANPTIIKYLITTRNKLKEFSKIAVSYSGGSDSDIVLDLIELVKPPEGGEIKYVFFDTGLEWDATIRHVKETAEKYDVKIERLRPKKTIPIAVKEYGVPFFTKECSEKIKYLQDHDFNFTTGFPDPIPKCKTGWEWWVNIKPRYGIGRQLYLKDYMMEHPPTFKISKRCCDFAKKSVAKQLFKTWPFTLGIDGQRQAENGVRASRFDSCFSPDLAKGYSEFRPLFFWNDDDKFQYKQWRNISYSDCYELWGFKRTGCVGCPFNTFVEEDLAIAQPYEPNKVKAAYAIFGQSYEYKRQYIEYKEKMKLLKKPKEK